MTSGTIPNLHPAFQDLMEEPDSTVHTESAPKHFYVRPFELVRDLSGDLFFGRVPAPHQQVKEHSHTERKIESTSGRKKSQKLLGQYPG